MTSAADGVPAFAQELSTTLPVHSQYVLHGNLRDVFLLGAPGPAPGPALGRPLDQQVREL